MRGPSARFAALVACACAIFFAPETRAENNFGVHWDVEGEAGLMKRFLANRPKGAGDAGFGPSMQLASHFALLPLVHVGAYLGGDVSPVSRGDTRVFGDGGLRVKGLIPVFPKSMRGWLFSGFGVAVQNHGGFFEVPFGLGVSYKFWPTHRGDWSVFSELGGKVGFAEHGSAYRGGNSFDRFGTGLSVGIMLDL
jgi:hypothetical protein